MAKNIDDFKYDFYDFSQRGHPDNRHALYIVDAIGMNCSPDHYDEIVEKIVRERLSRFSTEQYRQWAQEILEVIEAHKQSDSGKDLRGYVKNIHIRD